MAFVLWLMFWIAGQQAPVLQTPGSSSESSFLCTEPATTARGANGQYVNPVCASIDGVVVRAGSTTGIPNAQVILEFPNSGSQADVIKIVADSAGRFSFPSINPVMFPDGYNVTADADGYEHAIFGQIGNNESGELINFKGVQKHRNLTLPLIPYPSASGSVQTSGFQPVAAALIRAYRIQYTPIGRRLKIARSVLTNDLGDFRFAWIDPADYYVSASYSERARELAMAGTILTPNLSNPDSGYVTAFYPSAISSSDATAFTIRAGEKSNLNITLKESDRFKVHVHVFAGSTLQPQHFNIALMPAGADAGDAPDYAIQSNGSADFDIPNVGPGRYALVAFEKSRILSEAIPITVTDSAGKPFAGAQVVLAPSAERRNRPDPYRTATSDEDGHFELRGIPPGGYRLFAWEDIEEHAWLNSEFMSKYLDMGTAVSITANSNETVRVQMIPGKQ